MEKEMLKLLTEGAEQLGVPLEEETAAQFGRFADAMLEKNKVMNLTAVTEPREVVIRHFLDSLAVLRVQGAERAQRLIDVGCGAGFPGVPLKLARPAWEITFLDSLNKRLLFIEESLRSLQIGGYDCVHLRAEEAGTKENMRGRYDTAVSRAVARLRILAEYAMPLIKQGGLFIAMKGPEENSRDEMKEAKNALAVLGGTVERVETLTLPFSDRSRTLVCIRKERKTPDRYPRTAAKIAKNPL